MSLMLLQKFTSLRDGIEEWSLKLTTCMEDEKKELHITKKQMVMIQLENLG